MNTSLRNKLEKAGFDAFASGLRAPAQCAVFRDACKDLNENESCEKLVDAWEAGFNKVKMNQLKKSFPEFYK